MVLKAKTNKTKIGGTTYVKIPSKIEQDSQNPLKTNNIDLEIDTKKNRMILKDGKNNKNNRKTS